jgi:hypothetical protein
MTEIDKIQTDKKTERKAITGALILIGLLVTYGLYYLYIKSTSDYVYTTGTAWDIASSKSGIGKVIRYNYDNKYYEFDCLSNDCKRMKIGDKVLLKIYIDDPSAYDIIYDDKVDLSINPPTNGWKEIQDIK